MENVWAASATLLAIALGMFAVMQTWRLQDERDRRKWAEEDCKERDSRNQTLFLRNEESQKRLAALKARILDMADTV